MTFLFRNFKRFVGFLKNRSSFADVKNLHWYFRDMVKFRKSANDAVSRLEIFPCLRDKTNYTPIDATYFFQDTWAAAKIFHAKPQQHFDVGSSVMTVGILSQFVPLTMIDIRPIDLQVEGLTFKPGSILSIPAPDRSILSLSSLCVIEHIGLGRYGDPIDSHGSEKAAAELQRVLGENGDLYISVPVDSECKVYFNAHRAFTPAYIRKLFHELRLVEEKYHYGRALYDNYDASKEFGTGIFHFRRDSQE